MTTPTAPPATPITLAGIPTEGFTTQHGVPIVEIGEDGERLMILGHPSTRHVLAAVNAYYRSVGFRLIPTEGSWLRDMIAHGIDRTWGTAVDSGPMDGYWYINEAAEDDPGAQAVTWIDTELVDTQDTALQEECPLCNQPSRSTSFGWGPGRNLGGPHHSCRHCGHRWPAAPVYRPLLWKGREHPPREEPGGCFACHCCDRWRCTTDCDTAVEPITGLPLCTVCRSLHTADTWRELAAVGYGTPHEHYSFAEQRDLWLASRTQIGVPPAEAAQAWTERLALADHRARHDALYRRRTTAHRKETT